MLLDVIKSIILGIVQGLTEFLPISSTGHLVIAQSILGFPTDDAFRKTFVVFIQLGAVLALVWFYRSQLIELVTEAPHSQQARRLILAVLVAFVPAGIAGLLLQKVIFDNLFQSITVAIALIVGGLIILLVEARPQASYRFTNIGEVSIPAALFVGVAQCFSLIPGVSRSASSIVGGLLAGMDRTTATVFSFYLAIPTFGAAVLYSLYKSLKDKSIHGASDVLFLAVGLVASFVVAYWLVGAFLRFIQRNSFRGFAWYRIVLGIVVIALVFAAILSNTPPSQ